MRHELIHAFLYISIHAPTRGATKWIPCCGQSAQISIHAPARGATNSASMMSALSLFQSTLPQGERRGTQGKIRIHQNFNPRSHKGSDRMATSDKSRFKEISIHAPTRGATVSTQERAKIISEFQSTLPQGERPTYGFIVIYRQAFQSTLPQGERRGTISRGGTQINFNPRSHKGSDALEEHMDALTEISIHAPTRGATGASGDGPGADHISIHAPTRGATL